MKVLGNTEWRGFSSCHLTDSVKAVKGTQRTDPNHQKSQSHWPHSSLIHCQTPAGRCIASITSDLWHHYHISVPLWNSRHVHNFFLKLFPN